MGRRKNPNPPVILAVRLPPALAAKVDELVQRGLYFNRSDFIRDAVRQLLTKYYADTDKPLCA